MKNPRIGQRPDTPPTETVSGGVIVSGADSVNLGGDFYARLDIPHHADTPAFIAGLKAEVAASMKPASKKAKATDNESD